MCVKLYVMEVTGEEEELGCQPGYYKNCYQQNDLGTWRSQFGESSSGN